MRTRRPSIVAAMRISRLLTVTGDGCGTSPLAKTDTCKKSDRFHGAYHDENRNQALSKLRLAVDRRHWKTSVHALDLRRMRAPMAGPGTTRGNPAAVVGNPATEATATIRVEVAEMMTVSECPTCQAKAPIAKTWLRSSDGAILRRRRCEKCHNEWTTAERLLGDVAFSSVSATELSQMFEQLGIRIDLDR